MSVRLLVHLVALVMLGLAGILPAMACAAPAARMTASERACCRVMKGQCGQMAVARTHGCCQKSPTASQTSAVSARAVALAPVVLGAAGIAALELPVTGAEPYRWLGNAAHAPPEAPPPPLSSLRI